MPDLQFPASIVINALTPPEGVAVPVLAQISLKSPGMPIEMVFETPDWEFVQELAVALQDVAARMEACPENAEYSGAHNTIDPEAFDAKLRAAMQAANINVEADASPTPAPGAGENEGE